MKITSITHKLVLTIIVPLFIVLMVLGILNYYDTKSILRHMVSSEQGFIQNEIKSFIELQFVALDIIEEPIQKQLETYSKQLTQNYFSNTYNIENADLYKIRDELGMNPDTYDLYIINTDGIVVNTTYENDLGINFFNFGEVHKKFLLDIFRDGKFESPKFFFEDKTKKYKKYSYQSTKDKKYIIEIGLYSNQADRIFEYTLSHLSGIGKHRENLSAVDLFFWLDKPASLNPDVEFISDHLDILEKIKTEKTIEVNKNLKKKTAPDYSYLFIENENSKLIKGAIVRLTHNSNYRLGFEKKERQKFIVVFFIMMLIIVIITLLIRPLGKAIQKITGVAKELAIGNLSVNIDPKLTVRSDELGALSKAIDTLISSLTQTAEFARQTGKENFNEKYQLLSDKDALGKTLVKMQARLTRAKEEKDRITKEEQTNKFIADGLAHFSDILRSSSNNIDVLSKKLMEGLVNYLDIPMGAIFVVENTDEEIAFELKSAMAYGRQKLLNKKYRLGDGLVGRCAFEKLPVFLKEIPDDYLDITTGMGTANPKFIALFPLIANDEIHGVIELASFDELVAHKLTFVEKLAESIASTLSIVQINQQTVELLEQSKIQQEELAAQEQEMRQNMEELIGEEEILKNQLIELQQKLNTLNNALFVVEYDLNGVILDINDYYLNFLKVPANELMGKSFLEEAKIINLELSELQENFTSLQKTKYFKQNSIIHSNDKTIELSNHYWRLKHENKILKIAFTE